MLALLVMMPGLMLPLGPARSEDAARAILQDGREQLPERPDALIRDLYRARDGRDPEADPTRWTEPAVADQLFAPRLAALAVAEGQRAVPDRRVSFDPFAGATGAPTRRVLIKVIAQSATRADVDVRFPADSRSRNITFRLEPMAGGWRIADIWWGGDRARSLARLLR